MDEFHIRPLVPMNQTRSELANLPRKVMIQAVSDWPAFIGRAGVVDFANRRASIDFQKSEFGGLFVTGLWRQPSEYNGDQY